MTRLTRDETATELRRTLAALRGSTALTQPQLATSLGVSAKTVSRWELGEKRPTRAQVLDLLRVLRAAEGVDFERLAHLARLAGLDPGEHALPTTTHHAGAAASRLSAADVRTRADIALLATAEQLDISPRGLRQGLRAVLEAVETSGYTIAELRAVL
jgi:transcriptional regulator with XRE-family HTH domain